VTQDLHAHDRHVDLEHFRRPHQSVRMTYFLIATGEGVTHISRQLVSCRGNDVYTVLATFEPGIDP